jgi:EAL domain-containing protein (putative c-di-GMP-specific phosphodiesterase class I)
MFKQNTMEETEFYHKDLSYLEEFLLAHSSSKQAFINLSRIKEIIEKEELLEEIKRLIKEQIINQIRTTQGFY